MSTTTQNGLLRLDYVRNFASSDDKPSPKPHLKTPIAADEQDKEALEMDPYQEIQDVFMSPEEVMLYLKIGRTKCYELLQTSIPSYAIGRLRRVKKSDIDLWLSGQKYAPWE